MRRNKTVFRLDRSSGFSLIELMVGVLIAMLTMLLVTSVYSSAIWRKRDIAGGSDAQQSASMTMLQMGSFLKQAGNVTASPQSGLPVAWGCNLSATKGGASLLPLPVLPVPFSSLPINLSFAPAIIQSATGPRISDILLTMSSGLESSGIPFEITATSPTALNFANSNGLLAGGLLLTTNSASGDCNITQVDNSHTVTYTGNKWDKTSQEVKVGGVYAMSGALSGLNVKDMVYSLGQVPQFNAFGVDSLTQSLMVYDILQLDGITAPVTIAENVFLFRAIYGIDTNKDNLVDSWVAPTGQWGFDQLQGNTVAVQEQLRQIKAIRIALVTRSSYPASTDTFQEALQLFGSVDPSVAQIIVLNLPGEQRYRYQVYESVIPLFNTRKL